MNANTHPYKSLLAAVSSIAFVFLPVAAKAAQLDPTAARGKKVLYLYNQTKLEELQKALPTRGIVDGNPATPQKVARVQSERDNDIKLITYLESLGFMVTRGNQNSNVGMAQGKDLILISESVDAIEIAGRYRDTPVPLITFENDQLPFLEMTGHKIDLDTGTLGAHDPNGPQERFLEIINAPHPLAAGLSAGEHNVLDDDEYRINWGKPSPSAIVIATPRAEPDKAAIFAYEKGATMHAGYVAPARRVSFFLYADTFEHLRPEGLALFKAALLWAVSPPCGCS